jgi:GT2 family glycosyltransferase
VGLFDTAFESYLEDVDFGLRCATQGLGGVYVPDAVATHQGSASLGPWSPAMVRLVARNQVLLIAKHYPRSLLRRYWWPILVGQGLWGLLALRHGAAWPYLNGKLAGIRGAANPGCSRLSSRPPEQLAKILEHSEREIAATQRRVGFDWYWNVYFLLTKRRIDTEKAK